MFNLSVGSSIEWPHLGDMSFHVTANGVLSAEASGGMLRITAMAVGTCDLTMSVDDGFYLSVCIRVVKAHEGIKR